MRPAVAIGCVLALTFAVPACKKTPCADAPPSDDAKKYGIVLAGGHLCKDERTVATVDYPDAKNAPGIVALYDDKLAKDGFQARRLDDGTVLYTRGEVDTVFVVAGDASADRGLPFAIVRYCGAASCRKDLTELADEIVRYGDKKSPPK